MRSCRPSGATSSRRAESRGSDGPLGDQIVGKIEIEEVDAHRGRVSDMTRWRRVPTPAGDAGRCRGNRRGVLRILAAAHFPADAPHGGGGRRFIENVILKECEVTVAEGDAAHCLVSGAAGGGNSPALHPSGRQSVRAPASLLLEAAKRIRRRRPRALVLPGQHRRPPVLRGAWLSRRSASPTARDNEEKMPGRPLPLGSVIRLGLADIHHVGVGIRRPAAGRAGRPGRRSGARRRPRSASRGRGSPGSADAPGSRRRRRRSGCCRDGAGTAPAPCPSRSRPRRRVRAMAAVMSFSRAS